MSNWEFQNEDIRHKDISWSQNDSPKWKVFSRLSGTPCDVIQLFSFPWIAEMEGLRGEGERGERGNWRRRRGTALEISQRLIPRPRDIFTYDALIWGLSSAHQRRTDIVTLAKRWIKSISHHFIEEVHLPLGVYGRVRVWYRPSPSFFCQRINRANGGKCFMLHGKMYRVPLLHLCMWYSAFLSCSDFCEIC